MLTEDFVPVALDQWYERRQRDAKGDFYRKIAAQGPRSNFENTTQGHYACDASGKLLGFNGNHVDLDRVRSMMKKALDDFDPNSYDGVAAVEAGTLDSKFAFKPPVDGMVIRVHSKILAGYQQPKNSHESAFQNSVGQDNFWIQASEKNMLIKAVQENGDIPTAIAQRIARFHLIDNTRGEPPRWTFEEIESLGLKVQDGIINGSVKLLTKDGKRGYEASLFGHIEVDGDDVTRFDMVADGKFWGEGQYTNWAPKGKFPMVVTFQIADPDRPEYQAVPHGAKGWLDDYYQTAE